METWRQVFHQNIVVASAYMLFCLNMISVTINGALALCIFHYLGFCLQEQPLRVLLVWTARCWIWVLPRLPHSLSIQWLWATGMGAAGAQKRRLRVKTKTKETWDTTTWRRLGYQDQLKGEYFLQYLTFSSAILPFACKHSLLDLCANLSWEGIVAGHLKSHTYLLHKSDV